VLGKLCRVQIFCEEHVQVFNILHKSLMHSSSNGRCMYDWLSPDADSEKVHDYTLNTAALVHQLEPPQLA